MSSNNTYIFIYFALTIFYSVLASRAFKRRNACPGIRSYMASLISCACLSFFDAMFHLIPSTDAATLFYGLTSLPLFFISVFVLFFLLQYLHVSNFTSRTAFLFLSVVPLIIGVLAATNPYHGLINNYFLVFDSAIFRVFFAEHTILYQAFTLYPLILEGICLALLIVRYRKMPAFFHAPMMIFMAGVGIFFLVSAFRSFNILNSSFDTSALIYTIPAMLFYYGLFYMGDTDILALARDTVFQELTHGVFVLDSKKVFVDINHEGRRLCKKIGMDPSGFYLGHVLNSMIDSPGNLFNPDTRILEVLHEGIRYYYHLPLKSIQNRYDDVVGHFLEVIDVSEQYRLIGRLSEIASRDALTGLLNRRSFDARMIDVDNTENMPIAILFGDVNGLKYANDTFGHEAGDRLLKAIAQVLSDTCPDAACVARFGGDEFVVIYARTTEEMARKYIDKINQNCENYCDEEFGHPSISFGVAVKTEKTQRMEDLLERADTEMYMRKKDSRRGRADPPHPVAPGDR